MKIGKATVPVTSISTSNSETIVVRGRDLCQELIGVASFTDYFHFLVLGRMPDGKSRRVLDATLVAIAEHGLVPSVQASRMTYAAAPDALQGAVAAGILGCGSVILGASEAAGVLLDAIRRRAAQGSDIATAAREVIQEYRAAGKAIPGYGHPLHKARDPRVARLIDVAREEAIDTSYVDIALALEPAIEEIVGKALKLNVSAAIPALLLGIGFPIAALKGVPILARTAGLIGHLVEEARRPIGFALSYQASQAVEYDGEVPAGYRPG
ncbi:citryl-CoA lyase [Bordetella bronchialis]|uniref:citrate synthase (unknown stereospecificity) n=1 Tax=Bordetella bronchialis TaxID=463025 RepID=A0ABM6CT01_9BORD|nr:citryl-CoA lyase [Bordetella bronchialis]ANN67197.1 citryl-CoA lyase [Bordetella bronchialis]